MKKKTTMFIYSVLVCVLAIFASCNAPKKVVAPPPPPPKPVKPITRAEQISRKAEIRFSGIEDTFALKVQKIEQQTMTSDSTSVDDELLKAAEAFKNDSKQFLKDYIAEWKSYVEDSVTSRIEQFQRIRFTGEYIKVPRVKQILEETVIRNGISKTFKQVLPEGFDLGKTLFYFMRGGDTAYHLVGNPLTNEMPYYDGVSKTKPSARALASIINKYIMSDTVAFKEVKVIKTEDYRKIYAASTALEFWLDWTAQQWANYMYAAARKNIHKGQALH